MKIGLYIASGCGVVVGGAVLFYQHVYNGPKQKVCRRFKRGCRVKGLRQVPEHQVKRSIIDAFCNREDTDSMYGVVYGAEGTGKSNILRRICEESCDPTNRPLGKPSGVLYVELGSDKCFARKIAEICDIPLEPSFIDKTMTNQHFFWERHLTLPSNEIDALATVFPYIAEGGSLYKEKTRMVPVLIIDGADIIAIKNPELFDGLLEWAKKCANDNSVLVVIVISNGHVLQYLDKQKCKSRSMQFIEVTDFSEFQDLKDYFQQQQVPKDIAVCLFDEITGGRLTDINRAIRLYKELNEAGQLTSENIKKKIRCTFESEIKQALHKAMDDPSNKLQLEIAAAVVDRNALPGNHKLSVEMLALELVHHGVAASKDAAMKAMDTFVDNNILRYNKELCLVAYNKMAEKILEDRVKSSGIQERRCWRKGRKHHNSDKCLLDIRNGRNYESDNQSSRRNV